MLYISYLITFLILSEKSYQATDLTIFCCVFVAYCGDFW